jgi:hypothetical protein
MNNGPLNQVVGSSINLNYLKLFQLRPLIPPNRRHEGSTYGLDRAKGSQEDRPEGDMQLKEGIPDPIE